MKIIESFEKFTKNNKIDKYTLLFINNEISENQFYNYLESDNINESLSIIKDKLLNVLSTIIIKTKQIGFKVVEKLNSLIKWLTIKLKSIKDKSPKLYSVIRIMMIVSIVLIISISSVYAGSSVTPIPIEKIDMVIGLLRELPQDDGLFIFDINNAIAYLVDLRDGKLDIDGIINIAKAALQTVEKIKTEAISDDNQHLMNMCVELMNKGKEVLSAIVEKTDSTEKVTLKYK